MLAFSFQVFEFELSALLIINSSFKKCVNLKSLQCAISSMCFFIQGSFKNEWESPGMHAGS